MNAIERKRYILDELQRNGSVVITDLAERIQVSSMTIRRDLNAMAEDGMVTLEHGGAVLLHSLPGRKDTVRLGLTALLEQVPGLFGCMFLPGDQPLLRRETVEAMTALFCREQPSPAEWQKETEREIFRLGAVAENDPAPLVGSPVLFGSSFFPELLALPENKGGNVLLKKYPAQVRTVCIADSAELLDADTPEVLQQLEALARQKS